MLGTIATARRTRRGFTLFIPSTLLALGLATTSGPLHAQLQVQSPGQGVTASPSHPRARTAPEPQPFGWLSLFGRSGTDMAQAVAAHPQGGSIVCGLTQPDANTSSDVWVARLSPWGVPVWQQSIGGASDDEAKAVLVTDDGGCILAGRTGSVGAGGFDAWAARLDASGGVLWQRTFGGPGDDEFRALAPSPDGFFVGGSLHDAVSNNDAWVLELDLSGNILWQQRFDAREQDVIHSMSATPDGGVVFCADSNSIFAPPEAPAAPSIAFFRPWIVKLTGDGVASWQKTYNYSDGDTWRTIVSLDDGGYVVSGELLATGFFGGEAWVARLDEFGDVLWDWRFGDNFSNNNDDEGISVQPTDDGGFMVLGSTLTAGAGSMDVWVLKLDADGLLQWTRTIGDVGFDAGIAMTAAPGGAMLLAGRMQIGTPGNTEALVVQMRGDGGIGLGCDLGSPTAPIVWTDALQVDAAELAPTATAVVGMATGFAVVGLVDGGVVCSP